jgi:putative hydrolase of HD superfamily
MRNTRIPAAAGKLKRTKRTGWVRAGIPDPESVADHSYRVAILTMIAAADSPVDQLKAIKMALVHDLVEAETGDIVALPHGGAVLSADEKHRLEMAAAARIFPDDDDAEYAALYREYAAGITPEAILVKELDRLEMAYQAAEYEDRHGIDLTEFIDSADAFIRSDRLKNDVNAIKNRRKK